MLLIFGASVGLGCCLQWLAARSLMIVAGCLLLAVSPSLILICVLILHPGHPNHSTAQRVRIIRELNETRYDMNLCESEKIANTSSTNIGTMQ